MIDEGETDWKIVVIDVEDELAASTSKHSDIAAAKVSEVYTFLRDYKIPSGKPANTFGFNGALLNKEFAVKVTQRTHHEWQALVDGKTPAGKIDLCVFHILQVFFFHTGITVTPLNTFLSA